MNIDFPNVDSDGRNGRSFNDNDDDDISNDVCNDVSNDNNNDKDDGIRRRLLVHQHQQEIGFSNLPTSKTTTTHHTHHTHHHTHNNNNDNNSNCTSSSKDRHRRISQVDLPRMVHRNLPFHQSRNNVRMKNSDTKLLWRLMILDWFHSLLRLPAYLSISFLLFLWILLVIFYAAIYWYLDNIQYGSIDCGLGPTLSPQGTANIPIVFMGAFAFSLETCTTVGYGLPGASDAFFEEGCELLVITIFTQMMWSMMFNAFLFSFFFSLMSKSEFRSSQIIFTNKLLINVNTDGKKAYARLQCYDIDSSHPLVEAHARMYVLDHKLKMHPLRLADPNDDLGGVLYPSVPSDIVHLIDHHSVLSPRSKCPLIESSNGLTLRSVDSHTGNRDEIICPICGEAYGTYKRLQKHIDYNAMIESTTENFIFPKGKSHIDFVVPKIEPLTLEEVRNHIEHTLSEIIVVVEAIDPQLSGTFQSLQSYKYNDIVFGAEFSNCMSSNDGIFCVDMKRFHKTCSQSSSIHSTDSSIINNDNSNNSSNSSSDKQKSSFAGTRSLSNISERSDEESNDENDGDGDDDNDNNDNDDNDDDEENINYFRRSYNTFESSTRQSSFWRDSKPTIV